MRSELVTVPSFSPQPEAGSRTSAYRVVSVGQQSETTTNGQISSAARTLSARGMLAAGLVAAIQIALTRPSATASNISTAFSPGLGASDGAFQNAVNAARSAGSSKRICAAS